MNIVAAPKTGKTWCNETRTHDRLARIEKKLDACSNAYRTHGRVRQRRMPGAVLFKSCLGHSLSSGLAVSFHGLNLPSRHFMVRIEKQVRAERNRWLPGKFHIGFRGVPAARKKVLPAEAPDIPYPPYGLGKRTCASDNAPDRDTHCRQTEAVPISGTRPPHMSCNRTGIR